MRNRPFPTLTLVAAACPLVAAACATSGGAPPAGPPAEVVEDDLAALVREVLPGLGDRPITREGLDRALEAHARGELGATRAEAVDAVHQGDLRRARRLIDALVLEDALARGRALFAEGNARDALAVLDEAAALAPRDEEVLILRGEAALAVGQEIGSLDFLEDALDCFRRASAGADPRAHLGASRAAYQTSRFDEALDHARAGMRRIAAVRDEPALSEAPERTWARAGLQAYIAEKGLPEDEREPEREAELFDETRDALTRLVGREPVASWPRLRLADLYEWAGRTEDARDAVARGITLAPDDPELHARLVQVLRAVGEAEGGIEAGREAVLAWYAGFQAEHPDVALGVWYPAIERFNAALDELLGGADTRDELAAIESELARCRGLEPSFTDSCIAYELMCRNATGWCAYHAGDLDAARQAFQSMDDLAPRGTEWEYAGKLESGVRGLEFVASKYWEQPDDVESQRKAARIYDFLRAYVPDNADFHNNAGFFNRDTAVAIELEAQKLVRQLERADGAERARMEAEIARLFTEAREIVERSYLAYVDAARLAPDDVRIVNDTGLILAYYIQDRTEEAERYLREAIRLGDEQVPQADGLPEEERDALLEAWGDAYQNLGVVYLTQRKDPGRARGFFEKAVEIGPIPRTIIVERYLPACDRAAAGDASAMVEVWGRKP